MSEEGGNDDTITCGKSRYGTQSVDVARLPWLCNAIKISRSCKKWLMYNCNDGAGHRELEGGRILKFRFKLIRAKYWECIIHYVEVDKRSDVSTPKMSLLVGLEKTGSMITKKDPYPFSAETYSPSFSYSLRWWVIARHETGSHPWHCAGNIS